MSQLALPLRLDDHAIFDTFLAVGNEQVAEHLASLADSPGRQGAWLWGGAATGKTHLVQATCERFADRAVYLPIQDVAGAGPGLLAGLSNRDLVAIDDIDGVVGNDEWERALFNLYNEIDEAGGQLVVSARAAQRETGFVLPDLQSRMQRLPTFRVIALDDEASVSALQLRARHRGLDLPTETARYLLTRRARDMRSLYELLDTLDREAMRAQRRLTIPFVKDVLGKS